MNELQIFKNEEFGEVRTVTINNEPWFVGKDVAEALGYLKARNAILAHVSDEDKKDAPIQGTPGGTQNMIIINESGLYALIFGSKLESAKRFKHWVTSEVLPTIRKTGRYQMQTPHGKELLALAVLEAQKTIEEQNEQIKQMKPKALFADAVSASHTSILIGDLAKLLKQNGVETGQKRLFEWMRENGYLIKRKGSDWNMPTQRSMEMGLFEVKESTVNNPDGSVKINKTTKVTGKGQQYFVNRFLSVKG
ncbi:MAG: phage antirepressor [Lachnospiraceae bacterium]